MEENLKSQKMIPDKKENYKIIFTQKQVSFNYKK